MVETRFGAFDELMAHAAEPMRPIARRLRKIVLEVHPEAVEVVPLGDRAAIHDEGREAPGR